MPRRTNRVLTPAILTAVDPRLHTALQATLTRDPRVKAAWVFGSVARGEDGPESDVDVGVLFDHAERPRRLDELPLDLEADLASATGREIDLIVVDWAPVDLVHWVLRDGLLIVDQDRGARIRFEVDARRRYFDMLPILREYRKAAS